MSSNRIHPPRTCVNPDCEVVFLPSDYRMQYCTAQCRVNYYNDQQRQRSNTRYATDRVRHLCDQLLECMFNSPYFKEGCVHEESLQLLCIDPEVGTWEKNLDTGRPILWFYQYGLELVDPEKRLFTIHRRIKTKYHA